jgi:RNA polymerase sigma factor (sigma-70 family)
MARAPLVASSIGEPTDIELVDSVLRAAPGAFDLFYRRHKQLIYYCILKQAGPRYAEDLCSAFFERLINRDYRALSLWQRGSSLPLYLRKIVRNFVIDFQRRRRREEAVGGLEELEALRHAKPIREGARAHHELDEETITTKIILEEFRRLAIQAWAALEEPRDRKLMCDKLHRNMSNETIAERVQLAAGALRTAVSRAQVRLLAKLRPLAPEFFPDQA